MNIEEFEEIEKIKAEYEIAERANKSLLDFAYNDTKMTSGDGYYLCECQNIKFNIHLPTVIKAMKDFTDEKYKEFKKALKEV